MKQQSYCAIIGDINRSRSLPGRANVQRKFAAAVDTINKEFKTSIASKFLVTLGDEFQGLLLTPEVSYDLVRRFENLMEPVPFAFGVGIGALSTPLRKDKALGMDGEAFHRARTALKEAKRRRRTVYYSFDSEAEVLFNALIALMDKQWLRLTVRQKRIAQLLKDQSPKDVARRLRISTQAISKTKKSAAMVELEEAADALRQSLQKLKQPQKVVYEESTLKG
jgi:hypothetical protein